jgi:hypothetical protein
MFKTITNFGAVILVSASVFTAKAQMSFATKVDYSTGNQPFNHAVGDLNNDGLADFVVIIPGTNAINVFLGTGAGAFGGKVDYSTGTSSSPSHVAIGDLNNDGFKDLAVSNSLSDKVSVFTNTGTGSFGTRRDYSTGSEPLAIAMGDFNGDNIPDLVTANFFSNTISVLTNTGSGTFGVKRDYTTGFNSRPRSIAVGDMTNDGKMDIVVALQSFNAICVFTNTGVGTFGAKTDYGVGSTPFYVTVGDLNNDGLLDIVSANLSSNDISVLTNTGTSFGTKVDYSTGASSAPRSVAIADLNGDSSPDLAVALQNTDRIRIFTNTGISFDVKIDIVTGTTPYNVAIGDFNNDGKPDLASANYGGNNASIILNTSVFPKPPIVLPALTKNLTDGSITLNGTVDKACLPSAKIFKVSVSGSYLVRGAGSGCAVGTNTYSWYYDNNTVNNTNDDILLSQFANVTNISLLGANLSVGGYYVTIGTCRTVMIPTMGGMFIESTVQTTGTSDSYIFNPDVSILTQPINQSTCSGSNANLNIIVDGTYPQYIWNTGATTAGVNVPEGTYLVTVNGLCNSVISNEASISNEPTLITTHPSSVSTCAGTFATFQVFATGNGTLSYAWSNGLSTTSEMLTSTAGTNYDVTVTGACGSTVTNTFSLNTLTQTSISAQTPSESVCGGNFVNFGVSPTGLNLSYVWSLEGSGSTNNIYTSVPGIYTVTVSGTCGSVISGDFILTTLPGTRIITQPVSQIIQPSATASLSVSATGDNLMYLWNSNETVSAISGKEAGIYTVTVSGTCGSVVSEFATIVGLSVSNATISGVSANGPLTSASRITISGSGFSDMATITVNGIPLSGFTVSNGTMIVATIPAGNLLVSNNIILIQNPNQIASANTPVFIEDVTLSTNLPSYQYTNFSIYPNPVNNGEWRIENGELGEIMYVFNAQGLVVYSQSLVSESTLINANLSAGIYLVKVGKATKKLVVE